MLAGAQCVSKSRFVIGLSVIEIYYVKEYNFFVKGSENKTTDAYGGLNV